SLRRGAAHRGSHAGAFELDATESARRGGRGSRERHCWPGGGSMSSRIPTPPAAGQAAVDTSQSAQPGPAGKSKAKDMGSYHLEASDRAWRAASTRAERRRLEDERVLSGQDDASLLRKLWPFLRPQRVLLTVAVATSLLTSGISLCRPLIMLWAIDRSVATKD